MTSPYAFYQFWLNAEDAKRRRLPAGVHVPQPRGDRGAGARRPETARRPGRPSARSPRTSPTLVHGAEATRAGRGGEPGPVRAGRPGAGWTPARCADAVAELPSRRGAARAAPGRRPLRRHRAGRRAKSAARRAIAEGGAYVNNVKVADRGRDGRSGADLLHGRWLLLRRGRRVAGSRRAGDRLSAPVHGLRERCARCGRSCRAVTRRPDLTRAGAGCLRFSTSPGREERTPRGGRSRGWLPADEIRAPVATIRSSLVPGEPGTRRQIRSADLTGTCAGCAKLEGLPREQAERSRTRCASAP